MNTNLLHILSIVLSIITIVISILSYYGIIRYIRLYFSKSVDKYVENYTSLPVASEEKRVVVVLSVENETEIKNIYPTINSLLDQTVRINQMFLVLPCESNCNVPENLKKVVSIIKPGKTYDDTYQDIISILQREKEKDTIIIKVSIGVIYGNDFIENLLEISESATDFVIKDKANLFLLVKPSLILLDDEQKFISFLNNNVKDISYSENYKY
jgi:hypothetical protein